MKTLLVLRHAKSSWKHAGREDRDRPLNKRGKRDALRMAELVANEGLCPDVILSSPARRARKTAQAVQRACGGSALHLLEPFYPGGPTEYADALRALDNSIGSVMVVGHNPGLEEWLNMLGIAVDRFPTAALTNIELGLDDWAEMTSATPGTLRNLWKPREI